MLSPDQVAIETPEQIELQLEPAGLGSRFVAWFLDLDLKILIVLGIGLLALVFAGLAGAALPDWGEGYLLALLALAVGAVFMAYDVYFEVRNNGQTPGKKHQGLRVLREGGGPVDFRSACLRSLLAVADFLPLFYLLGAVVVLLTTKRQRLGDLAAGTMVIRERTTALVEHDAIIEDLATDEYRFGPEHLAACGAGDRQVLRSFFQRYDEMRPGPRHELADRLLGLFLEKTRYQLREPISTGPQAECFLACLFRDLDQWVRHGR